MRRNLIGALANHIAFTALDIIEVSEPERAFGILLMACGRFEE